MPVGLRRRDRLDVGPSELVDESGCASDGDGHRFGGCALWPARSNTSRPYFPLSTLAHSACVVSRITDLEALE